ncbi:transposase [Listeria booriae]
MKGNFSIEEVCTELDVQDNTLYRWLQTTNNMLKVHL